MNFSNSILGRSNGYFLDFNNQCTAVFFRIALTEDEACMKTFIYQYDFKHLFKENVCFKILQNLP